MVQPLSRTGFHGDIYPVNPHAAAIAGFAEGELDLNPIFALPPGQGRRIADARIRVESNVSR